MTGHVSFIFVRASLLSKVLFSQFETISHFLSPHESPPSMLLNRTDEEDNITLPSPTTREFFQSLFIISPLMSLFLRPPWLRRHHFGGLRIITSCIRYVVLNIHGALSLSPV